MQTYSLLPVLQLSLGSLGYRVYHWEYPYLRDSPTWSKIYVWCLRFINSSTIFFLNVLLSWRLFWTQGIWRSLEVNGKDRYYTDNLTGIRRHYDKAYKGHRRDLWNSETGGTNLHWRRGKCSLRKWHLIQDLKKVNISQVTGNTDLIWADKNSSFWTASALLPSEENIP